MRTQDISDFLQKFPLPPAFFEGQPTNGESLAALYKRAAYARGTKSEYWGNWLELKRILGIELSQAVEELSDKELAALVKWGRITRGPEFETLFHVHFLRRRQLTDYPIQEDSIYYLDLLLNADRVEDVKVFFQERFDDAGAGECYWERSRLALAHCLSGDHPSAEGEYLSLSNAMGESHGDIVALRAAMLQCMGNRVDALKCVRAAREKGISDEGLNLRISRLLDEVGEAENRPSDLGGSAEGRDTLRSVVDTVLADEDANFLTKVRRFSAAMDREANAERRKESDT